MIKNPILPGFNPDPCICRKGDDLYIAVSSFEWFPGIPIYHSRDMKNWELLTHVLNNDNEPVLRGLPSAKGIWAPCLSYCEEDDLFYVVYGVMNSMNARYFDIDNFLVTAKDIRGPWSEPVYIHSTGFDASLFHDDDGKKYIVALEWETRRDYEKPGPICIAEYDPAQKCIVGEIRRIWRGGTDRGCIEAPHMYKRGGYYYIMCAEGGTGYYHCVTVGRSESVYGPYEPDPENPILTSQPAVMNERADWDHLKPRYFNPDSVLQKSGHGSIVTLSNGETWMAHLTARPFRENLRCTLGRETALQRMYWTRDGWLRLEGGGNLAKEMVEDSNLPEYPLPQDPERDDFDSADLPLHFYAPRNDPKGFTDLKVRPGYIRIRGQESGTSLNRASILARKLKSVNASALTKMDFHPESYQHTAGLIVYYDNMNFRYLYKTFSEREGTCVLSVLGLENGEKTEYSDAKTKVDDERELFLKIDIDGRKSHFSWSYDGEKFADIGPVFDTSLLSDEYSKYGEFTGTFVGMACGDRRMHTKCADFDFFELRTL